MNVVNHFEVLSGVHTRDVSLHTAIRENCLSNVRNSLTETMKQIAGHRNTFVNKEESEFSLTQSMMNPYNIGMFCLDKKTNINGWGIHSFQRTPPSNGQTSIYSGDLSLPPLVTRGNKSIESE